MPSENADEYMEHAYSREVLWCGVGKCPCVLDGTRRFLLKCSDCPVGRGEVEVKFVPVQKKVKK